MTLFSLSRKKLLLAALVVLLVLGAVVITVLPIVIRSVAVDRVARLTGRPVALDDVDLNLFTGRLALKKFRLGQKTGPEAAVEFQRLEVQIGFLPLLRGEILVRELAVDTPTIRVTRTGPGTFDFDDLLALVPPADPTKPKAKSTQIVSLSALAVRGLTVVARDLAVTPAAEWRIDNLTVDARNLTTRVGATPGRLGVSLTLNGTPIAFKDGAVGLTPLRVSGNATIEGFDLALAQPYVPETLTALPAAGRLSLGLTLALERSETALTRLAASGDVSLDGFKAVRRGATEPFFTLGKLAVAIKEADLVKRVFTLASVSLDGVDARVTRDAQGNLDVLGLVAVTKAAREVAAASQAPPPADDATAAAPPIAVTLESVAIQGFRFALTDQSVTPATTLTVSNLTAAVRDVTWPDSSIAGRGASGKVALDGFRVSRGGVAEPLVSIPKLAVAIKDADIGKRVFTLASVDIDGLDARVTRDPQGKLDVLGLVAAAPEPEKAPAAPPAAARPAAGAPAAPPLAVTLESIALRGARFALTDQTVTPATTLTVSNLTATVRNGTWPNTKPLSFDVAFSLPTSGQITAKGQGTYQPLDIQIASVMRDGALSPYQPYLPIKARLDARFSAESQSRITAKDGKTVITSKGKSAIDGLVIRDPDAAADARPPVKIDKIEIVGLDFAWPGFAKVETLTITKPEFLLERNQQGVINLRDLFAAPGTPPTPAAPVVSTQGPPAPAKPAAPPPAAAPAQEAKPHPFENPANAIKLPLALDFGTIACVDGYARFLDRSTDPGFSETLERLNVTIEGLSSTPGKRAKLTAKSVVGGTATFSVNGELAPFGDLFADLTVELHDYVLASVNPYADAQIAWVIRQGKLQAKFHYLIDKDQITATNDVVLGNLQMQRSRESDEVKKRLGLPLGLIISLIKNSDGEIKINVPISGSLSDPKFDLNETIWAAIKNVLVNVLASPFRAIGRLFSGGGDDKIEDPKINPVAFVPGSAALTEEMQKHLTQVANFLRRSPYIKLDLLPVSTPRDSAALKAQALNLRIETLQREKKLKDFNDAVTEAFREKFPGVSSPKEPEGQLARLLETEPAADARLPELLARRTAAVRDALVKGEDIQANRLIAKDPVRAAGADEPSRVELQLSDSE